MMKRYRLETSVQTWQDLASYRTGIKSVAHLIEDPDGDLVNFEEIGPAFKALEDQIPDVRLARLEKRLLEAEGFCAECGQKVMGWEPLIGSFAPEWWATQKERGIDAATGHKLTCSKASKVQ